jgi:hypothetical protein
MGAGHVLADESNVPSWRIASQAGGMATARMMRDGETRVRVDIDKPGNETWAINLVFPCLPIEKGKGYRVTARIRSDQPRVVTLSASKDETPFGSVGLYRQLELTPKWKEFSFDFEANSSQSPARVYLDLGGHLGNVELASLVLEQGESRTVLFPSEPSENVEPAPQRASTSPVTRTDAWEFSTQGLSARCLVLSVHPWGIEVEVMEGSVDPAKVIVKRRMTIDGSKPTMEVKTNGPAELRYRILRGREARDSTLTIPAAGSHRLELGLGGLPASGSVEYQFLLGGKDLRWELRD